MSNLSETLAKFDFGDILKSKNDHCQRHGETVFTSYMGGEFGCRLCKDEQEQLRQQQERMAEFAMRKAVNLKRAGINEHLPTFDDWQFDSKQQVRQQSLLAKLRGYVANFGSDHPNILIIGGTGTGKTLMVNALASMIFEKNYHDNVPVCVVKTADFTKDCKASWTDKSQPSEQDLIKWYANVGFLVFDDLGDGDTAMSAEWACADRFRFGQVIDKRYQKAPTVITTNLTLEQVATFLGDRAWDRFSQKLIVIECNWESYRKTHKQMMNW